MAAQPRVDSNSGNDDDGADDALALSLLRDLVGIAVFLVSHPVHTAYILFFSRYLPFFYRCLILPSLAFFCPLLVTTFLLVVVLVTVAPYVGGGRYGSPEWPVSRFLWRTFGIAVGALCAELRPDAGVGLVGQLCSFVLGPGDVAAVLRVGEIMGELCDITGSCFLLEEKSLLSAAEEGNKLAIEPPLENLNVEKIFWDFDDFDEIKDAIEEKNVVCEGQNDFKFPDSSSPEHFCPSETFVEEMGEQRSDIKGQRLSLSETDGAGDGVEEKRLDCDPVSVEIKKCGLVKSHSLISLRIRQWEQQASGNFKPFLEDTEESPVESCVVKPFKVVKASMQLATDACNEKQTVVAAELKDVKQEQDKEFKDVRECLQLVTETYNNDQQAEAKVSIVQSNIFLQEQNHKDGKLEPELQEQKYKDEVQTEKQSQVQNQMDVQAELELQEHEFRDVQPEQILQEQSHKDVETDEEFHAEEYREVQPKQELQQQNYKDVLTDQELQKQDTNAVQLEQDLQDQEFRALPEELQEQEGKDMDEESEVMYDATLKSNSIARRVHSRTTSENLVSEGSPRKDKEWKRTLACKLYEERMQVILCRDRAVVGCSDNMDMLWEAYEAGGSGSNGANETKRSGSKAKTSSMQEEFSEQGEEEEDDEEEESSVRQLCCLQALKFSTRKMNFGGGKPSLAKISKVLKRMTALSRVGSKRSQKE